MVSSFHGSPEQDVFVFFEKWLKDENPLDTWVQFRIRTSNGRPS